ncbi:tRNA (cmo5U34)-methyltransferase [Acinetobacter calcoaceticus]|uniref:tRNA (Cmo5U34)-methyltransferase n=1 Tax=Acinetobacter calcoaceticus TaxID=471 RepID=A0A4R1XKF1_ACICA|nr:tRNA (cmo5U34)-methyltransferase [Acinetobacter calcoaceticus]
MAKDFNNQQVVEGYDQHIRKLIPGYELIHLQVAALLKSYVAEQADILVVGCGTGYELQYLAEQFPQWRFTAIDPAPNMLEKAKSHVAAKGLTEQIQFIQGDSSILDQVDRQFDAAVSILVSHFVPHPDKLDFFSHIAASLKSHGLCISYDLTLFKHSGQAQVLKQLVQSIGLVEAQANAMLERLENDFYLLDDGALQQCYLDAGFAEVEQFSQVLSYVGLVGFKTKTMTAVS